MPRTCRCVPTIRWSDRRGPGQGQSFDDLVQRHARRLRAVVLLGADRELILAALQRHARMCPWKWSPARTLEQWEVVTRAAGLAQTGTRCSWRRDAPHGTCSPTTPRGREFAAAVSSLEAR